MTQTERVRNTVGTVIMALIACLYIYATILAEVQLYQLGDILSGFRAPIYAVLTAGCLFTLTKAANRTGERVVGVLMWTPLAVLAAMERFGGAHVGPEMLAMLSLAVFSVPLVMPGKWGLMQVFRPFHDVPVAPPAYPPTSIVIDSKN